MRPTNWVTEFQIKLNVLLVTISGFAKRIVHSFDKMVHNYIRKKYVTMAAVTGMNDFSN